MKYPVVCASLLICTAAAPATCPAFITDAIGKHGLERVSVFDGPPEQLADLIPMEAHGMDVWDTSSIDPYLVCEYRKTAKTMAFHVVGTKYCAFGLKPTRAYCK